MNIIYRTLMQCNIFIRIYCTALISKVQKLKIITWYKYYELLLNKSFVLDYKKGLKHNSIVDLWLPFLLYLSSSVCHEMLKHEAQVTIENDFGAK